jgi:hypothetical protein
MDIDVVVFTLVAPIQHIQGHALHPYIMVDAAVPWFDPILRLAAKEHKNG